MVLSLSVECEVHCLCCMMSYLFTAYSIRFWSYGKSCKKQLRHMYSVLLWLWGQDYIHCYRFVILGHHFTCYIKVSIITIDRWFN